MKKLTSPNKMALLFFTMFLSGFAIANNAPLRKQLFNNNWLFYLGDVPRASSVNFDDASWRNLDLPHDWSIEGEFSLSNPAGNDGAYLPTGIGWYRKYFDVPELWSGKKVTVYFEGIYMNSEVFINGQSLGIYPYGYSSFYYDLTPYLKIGQQNIIAVRVDNSKQKNCRWYSGSGIYRHVWLYVTGDVHFDIWGVAITTPEVSDQKALVEVKTLINNQSGQTQNIVLSTSIFNDNEIEAGKHQTEISIPANSKKEVIQTLSLSQPARWSPETPNLYSAHMELSQNNNIIDKTTSIFGIRSITYSSGHGFLLNGKQVFLNGGCVHHDNGCLGAAAFDCAEERKVKLLKQAGFNAVRTSHNPPSEFFLDACDRFGLMVIDEAFDGWRTSKTTNDYAVVFDEWAQLDLEAMVKRDFNHPSIVMWSIGNEIIERTKPEAVETARMLTKTVHNIDHTRPVTSAMTSWNEGWEIFDSLMAEHDICGYNYQLHNAEADHKRVPDRVIVQTESYPKDAFWCWNMVQNHSYVIGDFVWTAIDYLGESGIGRWFYSGETPGEHWQHSLYPWHAAYCGDVDLTGWRKPISHYRSMLYNNTEKLYMAVREPEPLPLKIHTTMWGVWPAWESWTWPGHNGKDIEVEVYSKYEKIRLYLNDTFIGEHTTSFKTEFKTIFSLPYMPGVLKAVALNGDVEMETVFLRTAGEASEIKLITDQNILMANGQDLAFVIVELTDISGNINPNSSKQLQFDIEGPGTIIGVGNGDIKDTMAYVSHTRKAFHGRAMAVLRCTNQKGLIKLSVSGNNLRTAELEIEVK